MKRLAYLACMLLLLVGMSGCGQDGPLSKRSAKKAVERSAMFAKDSQVTEFQTGFYEATTAQLDQLAQLKAAGMVTYTAEGVMEYAKDRKWVPTYSYFYGMRYQSGGYYSYTERKIPHVFVSVSLTEEGKKYVIDKPTVMRKDYAELVKHNDDYKENLPDYMNAKDNTFEKLTGTAPERPKKEETVTDEVVVAADSMADTVVAVEAVEEEAPKEEPKKKASKSDDKNARFKSLQDRVKSETVNVLLGRFKVVKIIDVYCTEDMFKAGRGTCNVVFTFTDTTPFGYVLSDNKPDFYMLKNCSFRLYQDTGWALDDTTED